VAELFTTGGTESQGAVLLVTTLFTDFKVWSVDPRHGYLEGVCRRKPMTLD